MAKRPKKLKRDGIVEALFELRFTSNAISEVYLGRIVAAIVAIDQTMTVERLPLADIPAPMRRADPSLIYAATLQLKNAAGTRIARVGDNVVSWHATTPYPGWEVFGPEISRVLAAVQRSVEDLTIMRTGLRYLNFLNGDDHLIHGIVDLALDVTIGGKVIDYPINTNYMRDFPTHRVTMKVASPEFIQPRQPNVAVFIDVDVHTDDRGPPSFEAIGSWVETAHNLLKERIFLANKARHSE
ncbi:uncharacterized protein (TIGR04255 family) [Bradyrhizobium japonicum]|uniref:TIGR04255 family protein n=1 Tax=Bradyrhizobium diazoefficiens TaxID=1355477 RepID=UPI0034947E92